MKMVINTLLLILLVSCGTEQGEAAVQDEQNSTTEAQMFLQIVSTPHVEMDSINTKTKIVCGDANYWGIVKRGKEVVPFLIEKLKSTKPVIAKAPCEDANLTEGALAFILLDEILNIPYFLVLEMQYDVLSIDCMFPFALIEDVTANPEWIHEKLSAWYIKSANQYREVSIGSDEQTDCQAKFRITTKLIFED